MCLHAEGYVPVVLHLVLVVAGKYFLFIFLNVGLFSVSKSSMYLNVLLKFFAAWLFCCSFSFINLYS